MRFWLGTGALAAHQQGLAGRAFAASSLSIAAVMVTAAAGLFPRLVPTLGSAGESLTAANASSSELTLKTMLILAAIGVPLVAAYTVWIYKSFSGKIQLDETPASLYS